jgi:hypothetical protein
MEEIGMTETAKNGPTAKHRLANPWIWLVPILALIVWANYYFSHLNPLPSDEEMIAHLQKHRADIEELIRRYRAFEPPPSQPHSMWMQQGDTAELIRRVGIRQLEYASGPPWLPDPYSAETAKKIESTKGYEIMYKHGAILIQLADPRYMKGSLLYMNTIWKDFYFIPEVPRIENGRLLRPPYKGMMRPGDRVLPSLNDFPKDWGRAECVKRQIEPQWFITMCRV